MSIPYYIERSTHFFVLAPPAEHFDQGVECNYDSWRQRGWCRMELWVNFLSRNFRTALVISGRPKLS
eukprot:15075152-Heterocapsa_arctica.AAC.1